jgi:DNA mismatch repair protein MutS
MSLTPMMQQYLDIKQAHQDHLLMFRLGDFYELFFDDAITASQVLEITLTGRDAGSAGRVPMCGVPYHAAEQYIARLIDRGYSVAICEQTEDPKEVKGLVKREVVRVITPGTALQDEGNRHRFLAAIVYQKGVWGAAFVDVGTGDVWCMEENDEHQLLEAMLEWEPVELLIYDDVDTETWSWLQQFKAQREVRISKRKASKAAFDRAVEEVCRQYGTQSLIPLDLDALQAATEALGVALSYVRETQKQTLSHLREPKIVGRDAYLHLDLTAIRNLELVESSRTRTRKGSLLGLLDRTKTSMGSRLLKRWVLEPLQNLEAIHGRLDAVEYLVANLFVRSQVEQALSEVYDLDRLSGRIAFGSANARDLLALAKSLTKLPELKSVFTQCHAQLLRETAERIPNLDEIALEILDTFVDEPPVSVHGGGMIRQGVDSALDELRELNASSKSWLAALEQRERERTGIKSLKIGFNKVFGYYLEVSKANVHLVPPEYERRQTLAGAERYVLPELKEKEALILNAEERIVEREYELFQALRNRVMERLEDIQRASDCVAVMDCLLALAVVSSEQRYVRPEVVEKRGVHIVEGRHPVVEAMSQGKFVPNDTLLDEHQELILITGPNMAGKSTYMRQTALIVVLAHIGCFVPAKHARIGIVDRIFTRIGASDDLAAGQSTFMVEMVELAQILRKATSRSLVLLDEIGRGTSTYDGLCIAEAVMERLQSPDLRPLTLFATHYHELTETANRLPTTANYSVLVDETEDGICFLHTVVNRPADKSYGIQVARLAGIPETVITRAMELLRERERARDAELASLPRAVESTVEPKEESTVEPTVEPKEANVRTARTEAAVALESGTQLPLFTSASRTFVEKVARQNVLNMTPMEAINWLFTLVNEAREVLEWDKSE